MGVKGSGMTTRADSPTRIAPPATRATSRTSPPGMTSARVRGPTLVMLDMRHTLVGARSASRRAQDRRSVDGQDRRVGPFRSCSWFCLPSSPVAARQARRPQPARPRRRLRPGPASRHLWRLTTRRRPPRVRRPVDRCHERVTALSLREQVGQLFMVGVSTAGPSGADEAVLRSSAAGSVVLLGNTSAGAKAVARVVKRVRKAADSPAGVGLLVAADQEGGQVQRLQGRGFRQNPRRVRAGRLVRRRTDQASCGLGERSTGRRGGCRPGAGRRRRTGGTARPQRPDRPVGPRLRCRS